jgi:hypothetical protein
MLKSHGHLRKLYLNYRTRFFDNGIPEDTVVCWSADIPKHLAGDTDLHTDVDGHEFFVIRLNPVLREYIHYYKQTLIHEMCHVKLWPDKRHGRKFDAEMLRVACAGGLNKLW